MRNRLFPWYAGRNMARWAIVVLVLAMALIYPLPSLSSPHVASAVPQAMPAEGYLLLDGYDDYTSTPDHSELDIGANSLTVEAWVQFRSTNACQVARKTDAYGLYTTEISGSRYLCWFIGGTGRIVCSSTGIQSSDWHHVAGVYDRPAGEIRLYIDGTRHVVDSQVGQVTIPNNDDSLQVGDNLAGLVDEVRVSATARYSGGSHSVPYQPFACDEHTRALWHFDEHDGATEMHDACSQDNLLAGYEGARVENLTSARYYLTYLPLTLKNWEPGQPPPPSGKWVMECIDCPKSLDDMVGRGLRLDTGGHPHVAYGGDHLYYAWHDGMSWHYETVDDADVVGRFASLFLDGNDEPHVSYYDAVNTDLKYAYQDASGWHTETVDATGDVGRYTSLALDVDGYPHVSYFDTTNSSSRALCYAYQDSSGWHTETVDTGLGQYGRHTSLILDGDGYPHITYYDNAGTALQHAYQDAAGWHVETVDDGGIVAYYNSLARDGAGVLHVSYFDLTTDSLRYAYRDAGIWHTKTVDTALGNSGGHTSLALDTDGYPHISYYDYTWSREDLRYAYLDASGWHTETVDTENDVGRYSSLALDGNDRPHISYFDDDEDNLKYAFRDGADWQIGIVDSGGSVGRYTSLALDTAGWPHASYYDEGKLSLKYIYRDASGWHAETVDGGGYRVGLDTSLVLDANGHPHISYEADYLVGNKGLQRNLKYAYRDTSGWHTDVLDTGDAAFSGDTSIALDEDGYIYISYVNDGLKLAYQNASGWHIEPVDSNGHFQTSLALDSSGQPHISYLEVNQQQLRHAYRDGSGWHIDTLYTGLGNVAYGYTSLALDGDGYPHIAYRHVDAGEMRYTYQDHLGWHRRIVDSQGNVGLYPSLVVDGQGSPHMSYYDNTLYAPKYARRHALASIGWQIEVVDVGSDVGGYSSLALDENGYPHITYYDYGNDGLKYARYSVTR